MDKIILLKELDDLHKIFQDRKIRLFKIGTKRIAVVRINGEFYAFDNHCPHSDYPLNEGTVNFKNEIVCPWHNYMFSLHTGLESQNRCAKMCLYDVKMEDGMLVLYF